MGGNAIRRGDSVEGEDPTLRVMSTMKLGPRRLSRRASLRAEPRPSLARVDPGHVAFALSLVIYRRRIQVITVVGNLTASLGERVVPEMLSHGIVIHHLLPCQRTRRQEPRIL